MSERPRQNLMDYMVIAISPALIMVMVGSLLFFLTTAFYHGQYEARLTFIFAMFVMAIVCIARISMERGIEYATLFAIPLALVTMLAMARFVKIQGPLADYSLIINFALIGLVWWSAHQLTWDCTLIDDSQDSSGEGLLQGMGFDGETVASQAAEQRGTAKNSQDSQRNSRREQRDGSGPQWWQRMMQRRHRPHTPGVWVVYYAIAALPLFAFGQWLIPSEDARARLWAFRWLVLYVGSALGLLLTTSFLGLRRYLRQRKMEMPLDMAGLWLGIGAFMILGLLVFCVLLPRPGAAVSISQVPIRFGSPDHQRTHRQALGNDGPQRPEQATRTRNDATESGEQAPTETKGAGKASSSGQSQSQRSASGQQQGRPGKQNQSGPSESNRQQSGRNGQDASPSRPSDSHRSRADQSSPKQSERQQGDSRAASRQQQPARKDGSQVNANQIDSKTSSPDSSRNQPRGDQSSGKSSSGKSSPEDRSPQASRSTDGPRDSASQPGDRSARQQDSSGESADAERSDQQGRQSADEPQGRGRQPSETRDPARSDRSSSGSSNTGQSGIMRSLTRLIGGMGVLLKLLFWAALIVILAYFGWKHRDQIMAAIEQLISDIRNLLARLLGGDRAGVDGQDDTAPLVQVMHKPFSSYDDPFVGGRDGQYSAEQLVRYTFEALEAWGRERGCPREHEQTPLEYAQRLAVEHPSLGVIAQQLADLYSRVAYGRERIARNRSDVMRQLWRHMRSTAAMPATPSSP